MITHNVFADLDTLALRAATTGEAAPAINVVRRTWLAVKVGFMRNGTTEALAADTPVTLVIKPLLDHAADPIALDITADVTGTGSARRYTLKALIDGTALRTQLTGKDSAQYSLQITCGTEEEEDYFISLPLAITITNAYAGEDDAAPDPLEASTWTWLKLRLPAILGFTHNDTDKQIAPDLAPRITAATAKTSPVDADVLPITDSAASHVLKKLTLANLKAFLASTFAASSHSHSNATTGAAGFLSTTDKTKLDAIEAAADVTDAGNVGAAIHGATGKSVPVDADSLGLIDSQASNVLKKLSLANFRTWLISTLGSAATLDVGTTADKIVQLDATGKLPPVDGSQLTGISGGGGGGASLLHVTGLIQGHTTPLVPATAPSCTIDCTSWNGTGGVITISRNAETMLVTLDTADPSNGSTWLDTTSLSNPADFGPALNSALAAFSAQFTTAYDSDTKVITLTAVLTGGSISLSASVSGSTGLATPTGTSGGDESPASGAIMSVQLIAGVTGKIIHPLRVIVKSDLGVSVKLRDGNDNDLLPAKSTTGDTWEEWALGASTMAKFFQGTDEDTGLFFCFTDAATGGSATIYVIADQADAP